jgi:hypothetical protein
MIGKGNIRIEFERATNNYELMRTFESIQDLDMAFISSAEKCTAFSIKPKDFESDKYKNEIRYLYTKRYFQTLDVSKLDNVADISKDWKHYNNIIKELKQISSGGYDTIHQSEAALGPAEKVLYYVLADGVLAGGTQGGDLRTSKGTFEVKAVDISGGYIVNFKTGGTFSVADTMQSVMKLKEEFYDELKFSGKLSEVKVTEIRTMRESKLTKKAFAEIEKNYQKNSHNQYFSHYPFIWVHNKGSKKGEIIEVGDTNKKDIFIYTITSGTVKPMIKL